MMATSAFDELSSCITFVGNKKLSLLLKKSLNIVKKWVYNWWASCKMASLNDVRIESLLQNDSDQVISRILGVHKNVIIEDITKNKSYYQYPIIDFEKGHSTAKRAFNTLLGSRTY